VRSPEVFDHETNPRFVTTGSAWGGGYQTPDWTYDTEYFYDPLARQTKVVYPDNTKQNTEYDHWTTIITNTNGIRSEARNDAFGRTNRVQEFNAGAMYQTAYAYDVLDRLTGVTDSAGNVTTMTYDWLGRKTAMQDPDMGQWFYGYDIDDNLKFQMDAVTDATNQRRATCFYYDTLNRLRGKTYPGGISDPLTFTCPADPGESGYAVTYRYDEGTNALNQTQKGFRTSMSDASGSASWQYDLLGRVLKESKTITGAPNNPYNTEYSYNTLSQVLTLKYPAGGQTVETVSTTYNAQNLPQTLNGTNGYISSASYNASDQLTNLTFPSGTTTNYTYDPKMLRLTALVTSGNIQNLSYQYDKVGNVKTITDALRGETTTFTYDDLNRLLTASIPNMYAHSWSYNNIGNMLTRNDNNGNVTYQYNDAAHKHAVTQIGSLYYCYDANGNMTKRGASNATCTTGGDTLTYDPENRLTSITVGANTTTYLYRCNSLSRGLEMNFQNS
jgi:YD repeat-containing protein